MKRMNVVIDEDALARAQKATGEKTYSGTINTALREVERMEILRDGLDRMDHMSWWPGYVEEYGPNPPVTEADLKRLRRSAHVVRATRPKKS
jgi:Arc/MetJ family transcription regulator